MNTSRRQLLFVGAFTTGALCIGRLATAPVSTAEAADEGRKAQTDRTGHDPRAIEKWMAAWMKTTDAHATGGPLHVSRFRDAIYFLTRPIAWRPNPGQDLEPVDVPAGFVTDFVSIPRLFWSVLRPDGEYTYPAIVHDYLYWTQTRSREHADLTFKLGMEEFDIDAATVWSIYTAVRAGGASSWNSNAKLRAAGEKRVLKRFPDDPKIRWSEWKIKPDVFE